MLHFKSKIINNNNTTYLNVDHTDITTFCNVARILGKKEMMNKHLIGKLKKKVIRYIFLHNLNSIYNTKIPNSFS